MSVRGERVTLRAQHLRAGGGAARGGGARARRDAPLHAAVRRGRAACTARVLSVSPAHRRRTALVVRYVVLQIDYDVRFRRCHRDVDY